MVSCLFFICESIKILKNYHLVTSMHAVHQLYFKRKSQATKPFRARGCKVNRCQYCQLAMDNCICDIRVQTGSKCKFVLLMHDIEVLKPSNTGRLIADVIPDTEAYLWSRTTVDNKLLQTLKDERYQPYVVFPEEYIFDNRPVVNKLDSLSTSKTPLFVMLDGSWQEAKKMFRKSPYLTNMPVISLSNDTLEALSFKSEYFLRKASKVGQLSTAEVASLLLQLNNDHLPSMHLLLWSELFSYRYQKSVCQTNLANPDVEQRYQAFLSNLPSR